MAKHKKRKPHRAYEFPLKPGQTREELYEEVIADSMRHPEEYTP